MNNETYKARCEIKGLRNPVGVGNMSRPVQPTIVTPVWCKSPGVFANLHFAWDHYDQATDEEVYILDRVAMGEMS